MLVLTRRVGEEIVIAGNIRVAVCDVRGGRVRLGITAPPCVSICREELAGNTGIPAVPEAPTVAHDKEAT